MYNNCLKGKQFDYPIYIDVEDDTGGRRWLRNAGKEAITDGIIGFCETLENLGYYVGIYANLDWFNNWINQDRVKDYDKWLAAWMSNKPSTYLGDRMWQFGGETNRIRSPYLAGQIVDQDYCYYDYPSIIKNGFNGYPKSTQPTPKPSPEPTPEPKKSNNEIAQEVLEGKWGNGEERKKRLTEAGYDYQAIQDIVNSIVYSDFKVGDKVRTIGKGNGASDGSANAARSGMTGTITRIINGANYPYLVSNGNPIGWYKKESLKRI